MRLLYSSLQLHRHCDPPNKAATIKMHFPLLPLLLSISVILTLIASTHSRVSSPSPFRLPTAPLSALPTSVDLLVYGSSNAAVTTAYAAGRHNLSVLFVTPYAHLGGLTTSGLSATDVGNASTIGGLAHSFYLKVGAVYGKTVPVYDFEPHVAEAVYEGWMEEVKGTVTIARGYILDSVEATATNITRVTFTDWTPSPSSPSSTPSSPTPLAPFTVTATVVVDATYEGDLLALAGVPFTVGRESRAQYNESLAGVTGNVVHGSPAGNQINVAVEPWVDANVTESGLIPGIDGQWDEVEGDGDDLVQAYNYRLCISTNASNQVAFTAPANYTNSAYVLYQRFISASGITTASSLFNGNALPQAKLDWNNGGGVSTDYFHFDLSKKYLLADTPERDVIRAMYQTWTQGLLYFLATDVSLPSPFRATMAQFGYCKDEFVDNGNSPYQLYVREGRRMVGGYVITQHDVDQDMGSKGGVKDGIALGSYNMDTHNGQRVAIYEPSEQRWVTRNEGDVQVKPARGPWPISYQGLVPKRGGVGNLLVPVCISASHMGYASARMEPVYMMMAHAVGLAAVQVVQQKRAVVQDVDVTALRAALLSEGAVLDHPSVDRVAALSE